MALILTLPFVKSSTVCNSNITNQEILFHEINQKVLHHTCNLHADIGHKEALKVINRILISVKSVGVLCGGLFFFFFFPLKPVLSSEVRRPTTHQSPLQPLYPQKYIPAHLIVSGGEEKTMRSIVIQLSPLNGIICTQNPNSKCLCGMGSIKIF